MTRDVIEPGMDPLQEQYRDKMRAAMDDLVRTFPGAGLTLFLYSTTEKRANYISNVDREISRAAIREWLDRTPEIKNTH